ncbi:tripartite tricarboxylate transporter permease [Marinobacterium sp. YM272]|uniref:tripartite tricarboxylate transporter permease n=1 Tax=Marinobacterium sp. YM272 TaxID=3421654 RepID=UPI003D7FB78C
MTLPVLIALVSGSLLGIVIGAIPGLGPGVAIAILLPVTFSLDPLSGITLLMGVYAGAWYGGAIPAILMNTPGTGVSVLTTYDGYPMTRAGQPQRALSLAYASSFFGGTFSVLVLAFMAPLLASFAKQFGAADMAMAALLAMVLVVTAHRGAQLATAAMLGLGLFLSTIGLEGAYGSPRYTFDSTWLMGGIPLISIILGLFAMSQAFTLIASPDVKKDVPAEVSQGLFSGFKEVLKYPRTLFRSSSFGVSMGILPGVGEFLAQFFSYSSAKRNSKTPDQFGKGAPEGIIASEASNNAVPAAALVPLLALGIPGEVLTAMMLAVFTIHNVDPGPTLFSENGAFVSGLYLSLFMMNFVIVAILIVATRWISLVTRVSDRLLGIAILCFAMAGTYSANYRLTDALLAAAFGLLGFALRRAQVPMVPIILGLVLGPILETRIRQALGGSNGDFTIFVERPISLVMLIIMVLLIGASIFNFRKKA